MINPYEAPQSIPTDAENLPQVSDVPTSWLIAGMSLLALIPMSYGFYEAIPDFYAIYFDQSLIPKHARAPGYLAHYIALPLLALWIMAELRFLFSRGKRAGKSLAFVYMFFTAMMLMAICEGLADWMGFNTRRPDLPPKTENSVGLFLLIFTGLLAYFSLLAYGHWHVHQLYKKDTTPA